MSTSGLPVAFFVTGTDTEVGKTLISCALLTCMTQRGWRSVGMKPVAAGAVLQDGVWSNEDVVALTGASNLPALDVLAAHINPYLFQVPAAPHIAALQEQRQIDLGLIVSSYEHLSKQAQALIVEGVGGVRVPFNDTHDSADLAQQLQLPVILVIGMRLGCISHALLTAEAIAARGLTLAGWVANCMQGEMAYLLENISALQARLPAPLLGCIPRLEQPTPEQVAELLQVGPLFGQFELVSSNSITTAEQ